MAAFDFAAAARGRRVVPSLAAVVVAFDRAAHKRTDVESKYTPREYLVRVTAASGSMGAPAILRRPAAAEFVNRCAGEEEAA